MELVMDSSLSETYKSNSQRIRVVTEVWTKNNIFCPRCMHKLSCFENNKPVADFYCSNCYEEFELKSKERALGRKIVDGAYKTMIKRLTASNNPNLFLLTYNDFQVIDFLLIPKHFFVSEIIEQRKPLGENAKRAGWLGCNILLEKIPVSGRIFYVRNKQVQTESSVSKLWNKSFFLRDIQKDQKGWLLDVIHCIESIKKTEFDLNDIYMFEDELLKNILRISLSAQK